VDQGGDLVAIVQEMLDDEAADGAGGAEDGDTHQGWFLVRGEREAVGAEAAPRHHGGRSQQDGVEGDRAGFLAAGVGDRGRHHHHGQSGRGLRGRHGAMSVAAGRIRPRAAANSTMPMKRTGR
jgi:hypothetical protein